MPEAPDYKMLQSWDGTDRKLTQMGLLGWRPRFLEVLNKPSIFTAVFAIGNFFMVMSFGILSLIIPILESVFNLNSKQTGLILMANDISGTLAAIVIANYCSARKTRWIGLGMLVVVIAALIPASTTLFAVYPQPKNHTVPVTGQINETVTIEHEIFGICNETRSDEQNESEGSYAIKNHKYYWMFVFGSLLQGIGAAPPGIAGVTYMDEIFKQKQFGVAISILYIVSFVGYPISMLAGTVFLGYYVTLTPPKGVTIASKEWVGAWWMGMFFPSIAVFVISFIVILFPRQMPAAKKVLKDKVKRGITTVLEKKNELGRSLKEITKDMIPAFKRVLKNKPLSCLILGDIFMFLQIGFYAYSPKIYAMAFRLDSKSVGRYLGITNIIAFVVGLIGGGLLMRWKEWELKTLQLIYATLTLLSIPFAFSQLMYCPVNTYAGVDVPYFPNISQLSSPSLTDVCNSDCGCTTAFYQPVCDEGVTYFSPCHAGCMAVETELVGTPEKVVSYTNCTCTKTGRAREGQCGTTCDTTLYISLTLHIFDMMFRFCGFAAHAYIYQRVVAEVDRTFTQGIRSSITRALGTLPAPILFGWVIDNFCTVWRSEDGITGNCWVYDVDRLILWITLLQIIIRLISSILYFLAWWIFPEKTVPPALVEGEFTYKKVLNGNGNCPQERDYGSANDHMGNEHEQ